MVLITSKLAFIPTKEYWRKGSVLFPCVTCNSKMHASITVFLSVSSFSGVLQGLQFIFAFFLSSQPADCKFLPNMVLSISYFQVHNGNHRLSHCLTCFGILSHIIPLYAIMSAQLIFLNFLFNVSVCFPQSRFRFRKIRDNRCQKSIFLAKSSFF